MNVVEITPAGCAWVFNEHGTPTKDDTLLLKAPETVSLVVFTGGEDVWPELYGENCRPETYYSTQRDLYEGKMFELAQKHNIPCVGICRGAQFLCVKNGDKLIQDITGHGGKHYLETSDGRILQCNSTHHQMQLPGKTAVPLAWSAKKLSKHYKNGDGLTEVDREYEVVYYPKINSVGIQFHPEWLGDEHEAVKYSQEVVKKYLFADKLAKAA